MQAHQSMKCGNAFRMCVCVCVCVCVCTCTGFSTCVPREGGGDYIAVIGKSYLKIMLFLVKKCISIHIETSTYKSPPEAYF